MKPCRVCGGRGVIRVADIYRNLRSGKVSVDWELAQTIPCGCRYKEAA